MKIIFLIIIALTLSGVLYVWLTHFTVIKEHQYCESDNDCIPFIFECGDCVDYSVAINKQFSDKYQKRYWNKCVGRFRNCDALPKGESECIDNLCSFIK